MESSQNVWSDFLHAASKDVSKKEANLIILGDSKVSCLSVADAVLDSLGQPLIKKRDIDIINYSYATVGYPNKRLNSGDYLGVIHINIMCDTTFEDVLVNSLQRLENQEIVFLIAIDFRETAFIMETLLKWLHTASEIIDKLFASKPELLQSWKSRWEQRLLSISQQLQQLQQSQQSQQPQQPASATPQDAAQPGSSSLLPRGLLTTNLGVPLFVVCTHTEIITQSKQFSELRLDFLQRCLRRVCLDHASSLAYFNTAKRGVAPSLTSNLLSLLFPSHYATPAPDFASRDELFIPAGADNAFLIDDLLVGTKLEAVTDFTAVFERPQVAAKRGSAAPQRILSEEEFFAQLVGTDEAASPLPRKSRRSVLQTKPRVSMQPQTAGSPAGSPIPRGGQSGQSGQSGQNGKTTTRNFFENLINGGSTTQTVVPRKSLNVGLLRKGDGTGKK